MNALLMKELYNLKRFAKTLGMILMLYAVIGMASEDFTFVSGMIVVLFTMMSVTSFSVDGMTQWDRYAATFPIPRRKLVLSKYLLSLILTGAGGVISLVLMTVISFLQNQFILADTLILTYTVCVVALMMAAVLFPPIYKFGVEKVRLMMLAVFVIPFGIFVLLNYLGVPMPGAAFYALLLQLSPFLLIAVFGTSYMISCKIMEQKEF